MSAPRLGSHWSERPRVRPDVVVTAVGNDLDGHLVVEFETVPAQRIGTARVATFLKHYEEAVK